MNEQTSYQDGVLSVRIDYLLDNMSDESKLDLVQRLSCEDVVIKHVADQIFDGCTEDGSWGSRSCSAGSKPSTALDAATRRAAKSSGETARNEVERLEQALERSEKRYRDLLEENARLRFPER